jgi:hypothetical protein
MEKKMNTTIDFEFCDGTVEKLTLAFYKIYQLRSKNKGLYDRYNKAMNNSANGNYDELEMITILYVAYNCANMGQENLMTEEEFMIKCGSDRVAVSKAVKELTNPKKQ